MFARLHSVAILCALLVLSACAKSVYAPASEVQKRAFVSDDAPYLQLMTMISNKSGAGGHSSLVVNGSQVIMYDPAGRYWNSLLPERDDVLFGLNPAMMQRYKSFHARDTHHVVSQRVYVSQAVAEIAYKAALEQGASPDAMCANNVSALLSKVPGFEAVGHTWSPKRLMNNFAKLPSVKTDKYYENDTGKN
ncbi:hypothetical protein BFP76_14310 [Amylibacter kogurei]|uniref:Lipoprotein n=1 Tax=Paramylibacter kogurei TaxID=1889778 RepID=A0A2G5K9C9_9RHOB|nr:hypothetical protein [Amylibacter kogurei]PIB26127.1 hypothetical protein BFP76_14310 [Amylibacter kogurei]